MIKTMLNTCIGILYPLVCACCKRPLFQTGNSHICSECYAAIKRHTPPFCVRCGRSLRSAKNIENGICAQCKENTYHFNRAWSLCAYEGIVKNLIHDFKYKQKIYYRDIFETLLKEFIDTYAPFTNLDIIIPVPLHAVKLREREYNQSFILAYALAVLLKKPLRSDCLVRIRNTKPQFSLHERERTQNVLGCFQLNNSEALKGKSILIVDDIMTTGTTVSEAARVVGTCNPASIEVLTLAS